MKSRNLVFALLMAGPFLASCAPALTQAPAPVPHAPVALPADNSCGASATLIGKPHTVLATMHFQNPMRVIWPDTIVTRDYSPQRINFILNKGGIIRNVHCG